jgi:hypothetical protein
MEKNTKPSKLGGFVFISPTGMVALVRIMNFGGRANWSEKCWTKAYSKLVENVFYGHGPVRLQYY